METNQFIEINSEIRFGKPCIKGTRISVLDVINWLDAGMSIEEIKNDFQELTNDQLEACISYNAQINQNNL
jgi:uncharacterized protein (DUF433 family)